MYNVLFQCNLQSSFSSKQQNYKTILFYTYSISWFSLSSSILLICKKTS